MSKPANFAAPEDVEQAFYEAVQKGDADLLILLWAEDEETLCVHPTGVRLTGIVPIRESWRAIFANTKIRVQA
jgi:ketosteroid isomerase-like protein